MECFLSASDFTQLFSFATSIIKSFKKYYFMKKLNLLFLFSILAIVLFSFQSCNKEELDLTTENEESGELKAVATSPTFSVYPMQADPVNADLLLQYDAVLNANITNLSHTVFYSTDYAHFGGFYDMNDNYYNWNDNKQNNSYTVVVQQDKTKNIRFKIQIYEFRYGYSNPVRMIKETSFSSEEQDLTLYKSMKNISDEYYLVFKITSENNQVTNLRCSLFENEPGEINGVKLKYNFYSVGYKSEQITWWQNPNDFVFCGIKRPFTYALCTFEKVNGVWKNISVRTDISNTSNISGYSLYSGTGTIKRDFYFSLVMVPAGFSYWSSGIPTDINRYFSILY